MLPSSSSHSALERMYLPQSPAQQAGAGAHPVPRAHSAPASIAGFSISRRAESRAVPAVFSAPARERLIEWNYNDSHFHPTQFTQQGRGPGELFADMDSLGIRCTTLMPIATNVLSSQPEPGWSPCSGRHHCGPSYYLPPRLMQSSTLSEEDMAEARQATELYINTGVDSSTALRYRQLTAAQRKRLDPMITGLHLGDMHSSTYLLQKLHEHPGVFTGVGEITLHKEVVEQLFAGQRQANLESNVAPLLKLLETCGMVGLPVVFHCDVDLPGARAQHAPAYLEGIQRLLADPAVAGTTIVWAHAGGLGRFVNAPAGHVRALRAMLSDSRFSHMHIDLSWTVVAERLVRNKETLADWVVLINDYPTRFLYGSDAVAPMDGERWNQTYGKYQDLLSGLTPACRRQVCTGNYERVFIAARRKVRAFERYILPGIIADLGRASTPRPASTAMTPVVATVPMLKVPESPEKARQ